MSTTERRPGVITFLSVIGMLQGIAALALGLFLVLDHDDQNLLRRINESDALESHQLTSNALLALGITGLVLGSATIIVALALASGSGLAKWLLGVVALLNAASGLHALVALHGEQQVAGSVTLTFSLFVLWVLFGYGPSQEYFEH